MVERSENYSLPRPQRKPSSKDSNALSRAAFYSSILKNSPLAQKLPEHYSPPKRNSPMRNSKNARDHNQFEKQVPIPEGDGPINIDENNSQTEDRFSHQERPTQTPTFFASQEKTTKIVSKIRPIQYEIRKAFEPDYGQSYSSNLCQGEQPDDHLSKNATTDNSAIYSKETPVKVKQELESSSQGAPTHNQSFQALTGNGLERKIQKRHASEMRRKLNASLNIHFFPSINDISSSRLYTYGGTDQSKTLLKKQSGNQSHINMHERDFREHESNTSHDDMGDFKSSKDHQMFRESNRSKGDSTQNQFAVMYGNNRTNKDWMLYYHQEPMNDFRKKHHNNSRLGIGKANSRIECKKLDKLSQHSGSERITSSESITAGQSPAQEDQLKALSGYKFESEHKSSRFHRKDSYSFDIQSSPRTLKKADTHSRGRFEVSNSRSFRESESFDAKLRNTNSESDVKDRFGSPVNRSFCAHMKSKKDFLRTPSPLLGDKYANLFQNGSKDQIMISEQVELKEKKKAERKDIILPQIRSRIISEELRSKREKCQLFKIDKNIPGPGTYNVNMQNKNNYSFSKETYTYLSKVLERQKKGERN